MMSKLSSLFRVMMAHLHVWVVLSSSLLVCASPWIFMGRRIPDNAGFWDYLHVYLGLACAVLGILFLLSNTLHGKMAPILWLASWRLGAVKTGYAWTHKRQIPRRRWQRVI